MLVEQLTTLPFSPNEYRVFQNMFEVENYVHNGKFSTKLSMKMMHNPLH